jgi:hypothetical protein
VSDDELILPTNLCGDLAPNHLIPNWWYTRPFNSKSVRGPLDPAPTAPIPKLKCGLQEYHSGNHRVWLKGTFCHLSWENKKHSVDPTLHPTLVEEIKRVGGQEFYSIGEPYYVPQSEWE